MNGALVRFVLRRHRVTFLLCFLVPVLVGTVIGIAYPMYAREREAFGRMTKVLGKLLDGLDLLSVQGFVALVHKHFLSIAAIAIFAATPALTLLSQERARGTLDLIMATPLRRRELVRSLAVAMMFADLFIGFAPLVGVMVGAEIAGIRDQVPWGDCTVLALNLAMVAWTLSAVGLLIAVRADDLGRGVARYVGAVFVLVAIEVVARLWKHADVLRWFTPFGYLRLPGVDPEAWSPWASISVLAVVTVAIVAVAELLMDRRRRV